jgi:CSLREA domain-containing protein
MRNKLLGSGQFFIVAAVFVLSSIPAFAQSFNTIDPSGAAQTSSERSNQHGTTIRVDTISDTSDSGTCTLRDAINTAQGSPVAGSSCNSSVNTVFLIVLKVE